MAKPKRFKPGQEVVCIEKPMGSVVHFKFGFPEPGVNYRQYIPEYNKEYVIRDYGRYQQKQWWVRLVGMPDNIFYEEIKFAPLLPDKAIAELLEQ